MDNSLLFIFYALPFLLVGIGLGDYIGRLRGREKLSRSEENASSFDRRNKELLEQVSKLTQSNQSLLAEREQLKIARTELSTKYEHLEEQFVKEQERFRNFEKDFNEKFENLAHKVMVEKTEKFTIANRENIENILKPLNEKIKSFEEKVGKTNEDFIRGHAKLEKQLEFLNEQNIRISEEANNLTRALKGDSKTQGNWGELILEKVLERSNLVKDREYFVQQTFVDDQGNKLIPDIVIHLPNEKRMIIDSKVSLRAYERYVNEEDAHQKQLHLKDHIKALMAHITSLSAKKYEDLLKGASPDFILMFIPIEPALSLAQNEDQSFFYSAFQRNILLVSPTTLLSTLRTIDALWTNEKQHQNAQEIAKHAASLYHKFQNLLTDLETVGARINSSKTSYDKAMLKLRGNQNLIKDIHRLEELGVSPKEKIKEHWLKQNEEEVQELPD